MRPLFEMDTIQIELTNACIRSCSNCTRFCGHTKPFFMDAKTFKNAVNSLEGFPHMVGFMGGEPLLHPLFVDFCWYARKKFPKRQLGLWTSLPSGLEFLREVICETFGHIFINDHSRDDIYHAPVLVAAEEVFDDLYDMFMVIEHCWVQECWSASINPNGAFFCEIAASMSILFDEGGGWPVEKGWWKRVPKDFKCQQERYCPMCGMALPFKRRLSIDGRDDISPGNFERLKYRSLKIKRGDYVISDLKLYRDVDRMAAYKDHLWRQRVASRYGIYLMLNELGFQTPILVKNWKPNEKSIFDEYVERYNATDKVQVECCV